MRRTFSPAQFTWLLSAALAAGAVLFTTRTGAAPIMAPHLPVAAVAVALGAGFFFAEQFLMNVEFRRQAHTFTLAGIPLLIGVLVVSPGVFVATRVAASLLVFMVQRVSVDKTAYNCAAYAFEAAANAMLVHLLLRPQHDLDLRSAIVLILALAVVDHFISALVLVMIRVHNGPLSRADVIDVLVPALVISVTSTIFALNVIILFGHGILGAAVAAMVLGLGAACYRAYAATRNRHLSLTLVHEFVTGAVGAQSLETLAEELLARIRRLLRASTVQVMIVDGDSDRVPSKLGPAMTLAIDEEDTLHVSHEDFDTADWVVVRTLAQQEPLLAGRTTKDPGVRHWLAGHGFRDAMMVALPASSGIQGTLRVTDRLGETTTFTAEDMTLLQTLTGHLAVALRSTRLGHDATHDSLTGLPNRRALYADGQARLVKTPSRRRALLLLDLDKFKEVNDTLGHQAGDQLLVEVSARLRGQMRSGDLLARLGGDEFAVLLEDAGSEEAERIADTLRSTLAEAFTPLTGSAEASRTLHTRASIGIALFPADGADLSALLHKADIAMYVAKTSGEGHHTYRDTDGGSTEQPAGPTKPQMVQELQTAMIADQLVLHYQPKIDLGTDAVHAVEALVRWEHPTRGLLYPDAFLPLIEETGQMRLMTRLVLRKALDQAADWQEQGQHLTIAVNLSPSSVTDLDLPEYILTLLAGRGVPTSALQLEITEEFLMAEHDQARTFLSRLGERGIQISIDDFGAGYSSLSYLRDLPINELKLDRAFISPMADDARAAALVASTIALAHSLNLRMVAEGVETEVAYRELARLGCDQAQGFFISRPVPAAELDHWLTNRHALNQSVHTPSRLNSGALA